MKKFLLSFLPVLALLGFSLKAQAQDYKVTLEWTTPGSIEVYTTYNCAAGTEVAVGDGTSVVFTEKKDYYVKAAPGYKLAAKYTEVSAAGTETKRNVASSGVVSVNQYSNGKTFRFECLKVENIGTFTFEVVNGADKVAASINGGTAIEPKDGVQTIAITNFDTELTLARANSSFTGDGFYSVTLDGAPVQKTSQWGNWQYVVPITKDSKVVVTVYDPDNVPVVVKLTADFAFENDGKDALMGVFNRTVFKTTDAAALAAADYKLACEKGDVLQINLNEDYTLNSIKVNGTPQDLSTTPVRVTMEEDATITIDATAKVYENQTATVYTNNIEALNMTLEYGNPDAPAIYEAKGELSADLTFNQPKKTITVPAGTKEYQVTNISGKTGRFFIEPKAGYWFKKGYMINRADVETAAEYDFSGGSVNVAEAPVYIEAAKVDYSAKATVYFTSPAQEVSARMQMLDPQGMPTSTTQLAQGYTEIEFDPTYNNTFKSIAAGDEGYSYYIYLNGVSQKADDNGVFIFDIEAGDVVKAFFVQTPPRKTEVTFEAEDGATAEITYDKVRPYTISATPLSSIGPTEVTIKPAEGVTVEIDGDAVELTDGVYTAIFAQATDVTLKAPVVVATPLKVNKFNPAEGSTVKSFSAAEVTFDIESINWHEVGFDAAKLSSITVAKKDGTPVSATGVEPGEGGEQGIPYTITFPEVTEAGEYTITIPAGLFYESAWNETTSSSEKVKNGSENAEITVTFTVDPNAKSPLETYTLDPAAGTALRSLSTIDLDFPDAENVETTPNAQWYRIYLTNDANEELLYMAKAEQTWNSDWSGRIWRLTLYDENMEEATVTTAGSWTLTIPEGYFTDGNETNAPIEAKYTIDPNAPLWRANPANGSKNELPAEGFQKIVFTFDGELDSTPTDDMAAAAVTYAGDDVSHVTIDEITSTPGWTMECEGNTATVFVSASLMKNPGVLAITIDEGRFTLDGKASPAISYSATFGDVKSYSYVLTPATNSTVTDLKEITLEFPDATTAAYNEDEAYIILQGAGSIYPGTNPEVTAVAGAEHPTFKISFPLWGTDFNALPGLYSLRIGEGTFTLDGNQKSEEIAASYIVERTSSVSFDFKASPDGEIVNTGDGIYVALLFDEEETVACTDPSAAEVTFAGEKLTYYSGHGTEPEGMYYTVELNYYEPYLIMVNGLGEEIYNSAKTGKFKVKFPAGTITVSGEAAPEIEYEWDVVSPKEYKVNLTPAAGTTVTSLKEIIVEIEGATTAEVNGNNFFTLKETGYRYFKNASSVEKVADTEYPTFKVTFDPAPTEAGNYVFEIGWNALSLDGNQTFNGYNSFKANYTLTKAQGITDIEADGDGKYTVVTIGGVVLMNRVEAEQLSTLAPGIYIINGKKTAVK